MSAPSQDNIDYARTSNVARMHAAVAREKSEPFTKATPISLGIIAGIMGLAIIAGSYFGSNTGSLGKWDAANIKGYGYKPELAGVDIIAPGMTEDQLHDPEVWIAQGRMEFTLCAPCHQLSGEGVAGQYPPLKNSEFVTKGERRLVAILRHGITGGLSVNGKAFNGVMQPLGSTNLNPKQLAQVLSFVRNEWGNKASIIYEDQVTALSKELGNRPSYTEAELRQIDENANAPASQWPEKLKKAAGGAAAAPAPAPAPAPK